MRYKLKLSRTNTVLDIVEIPADFGIKIGDVIVVNEKYHELKMIIRPTLTATEIENKGQTKEQFEKAMPILIIGDSFPLI